MDQAVSPLQSMENSLTEQRECRPSIHHALYEFEFIDFSFDQAVVLRKRQTCDNSRFVSFNTHNKALEFVNLAGSNVFKPGVELLACACAQHESELLNQLIGLI